MNALPADFIVRHVSGVMVIRLKLSNISSGSDIARLTTSITELVDAGNANLVLDLKHVKYVGSATLGLLLALRQSIDRAGGRLVLCNHQPVDELLGISKTTRLFTFAPDPKKALAVIKAELKRA